MPLGNASRTANILEHKTLRCSTVSNTPLSSNYFVARRDNSIHLAFRKSTCYIRDLKGNDLLTGSRGTDLYSISLQDSTTPNPICLMAKATSSQAWLWHRRLSHLNFDTINLLSKNNIVNGLPKLKFVKDHLCSSCELGKAKRKSFHTKTTPSSKRRLQLLHMDLCGPIRVESINGKKYVLVIIDDYSRYTWTHFLRSKDETPGVLIDFLTLVQRGLHAQVTTVRTDKGTEFLNKTLHAYFAKEGIRHETSTARTPEQNGVVERRNRTLVEAARTMLSAAKMASDHVSSDPGPQCSTTVLEQDSLSPGPQSQENVPQIAETVTTSNELELLYSPMFSELLNGTSPVVVKGIQIHQSPRGIFINQAKYAQEILKKHGMTSCDSIGTPMATKHLDADLSGYQLCLGVVGCRLVNYHLRSYIVVLSVTRREDVVDNLQEVSVRLILSLFVFGFTSLQVITAIATGIREFFEYMAYTTMMLSESSQPSWGNNVYIRGLSDFDVTMSTAGGRVLLLNLAWFMKYTAYVRRIDVDFSHAPLNEYSPSPNDKKQLSLNLFKIGCWFGGKLIQNTSPKGVYEESFFKEMLHGIGDLSCSSCILHMVHVKYKTMKIQAGVHVLRQGEL
ncbi:retrovirus-related pol polyprotein from transposon TNT 1-94 [Tanacetum coccineum]